MYGKAVGFERFGGEYIASGVTRSFEPSHLRLSREACRQSVAEFVKKWLVKEDRWRTDGFSAIVVVFPDEGKFDSDDRLEQFQREPSVKLQTPRD